MQTRTSGRTEEIEYREDEISRFITACEHVDRLRQLADILHRRNLVTPAYYHDVRDSITYIDGALLLGKQNTATLRRRA
jgi:hypothetical protein